MNERQVTKRGRGPRWGGGLAVALACGLLLGPLAGCAARPEAAPPVPWGRRGAGALAYEEPDHDRDGIDNAWDRCPDLPEDPDGFRDDDGCPDADNDGDGIADAKDPDP